jgi:hypothetical protein
MELTLPKGALSEQRAEIATFYSDLFGWDSIDVPILKQTGLLLRTDPETSQFILLTEQRKHMISPGYDHLGLLYETRDEVDALLEKATKWQERDGRVQIKEYEDLETAGTTPRLAGSFARSSSRLRSTPNRRSRRRSRRGRRGGQRAPSARWWGPLLRGRCSSVPTQGCSR